MWCSHRLNLWGTRGNGTPTFWTGVPYPTFQHTGEEFAVIRVDLWRLNYAKTVFGRGSAPDLARGAAQFTAVSLKHDGTDGTVKIANLPVPSVSDRRDRLSRLSVRQKHDGTEGTQKKRSKNT